MRKFIAVALATLVLMLSADAARAKEKEKSDADADFLTKAIPGIGASVKIIDYAAKNASDEKVKDFAERVGKQHKESVKTASEHAKRLKIAVVQCPTPGGRSCRGRPTTSTSSPQSAWPSTPRSRSA